jgi:hypothetical protein
VLRKNAIRMQAVALRAAIDEHQVLDKTEECLI